MTNDIALQVKEDLRANGYRFESDEGTGAKNGHADRDLLSGVRNAAWLDRQEFPDLEYHVEGLIPEGMTLLVAPPKCGKSFMVANIGLALATGGMALGAIEVSKRPVFYLALEDGERRLQKRLRDLLRGQPLPEGFDYVTKVEDNAVIETIEAWLELHEYEKPTVFLDTLGKAMPAVRMSTESPYQSDYRIAGRLKGLVDRHPGSALVINHHDRKAAAEDFVDAVSGTHGLAGAADGVLVVTRPRTQPEGTIKVTGRDVREGEYALSFVDGFWTVEGDDLAAAARQAKERRQEKNLGERAMDVLRYVQAHPEGVSPAEIAEALSTPEAQIGNHTAGTYLGRLLEQGRIRKLRRGVYAPVESVESVGTGSDQESVSTDSTVSTPPTEDAWTFGEVDGSCTACSERCISTLEGLLIHPNCAVEAAS